MEVIIERDPVVNNHIILLIVGAYLIISSFLCLYTNLMIIEAQGEVKEKRYNENKRVRSFINKTIVFTFPIVLFYTLRKKSYEKY